MSVEVVEVIITVAAVVGATTLVGILLQLRKEAQEGQPEQVKPVQDLPEHVLSEESPASKGQQYEERFLQSVEEGIAVLEERTLQSLRRGDTKGALSSMEGLEVLEDLRMTVYLEDEEED